MYFTSIFYIAQFILCLTFGHTHTCCGMGVAIRLGPGLTKILVRH
jgi:hypothetical protein